MLDEQNLGPNNKTCRELGVVAGKSYDDGKSEVLHSEQKQNKQRVNNRQMMEEC